MPLFVAAVLALVAANSPLAQLYASWAQAPLTLHVVNDGLMTLFFFVVGLDIKRELVAGELRTFQRALLPGIAALGGMIVPAAIYYGLNPSGAAAAGWGVPVATDIAFVIGCLALLGSRVPRGLAVFVVALAIFDDIGGIIVIALGYGSGIHVTIFGFLAALVVPKRWLDRSLRALHPVQTLVVMPIFAFVNAGVDMRGMTATSLAHPVPLGIALGLFFGKQVGIFAATALAIKARLAPMPRGGTWWALYGVSILAGIGFTVALFIAGLAFTGVPELLGLAKVGIIVGSVVSGGIGCLVLRLQTPRQVA